MNDLILESGNPYSLSELFSGDSKIIVPDMQRDYCWGDKNNESLVLKFLESLFESFEDNKNTELQLGMIYAYESPKNHIQLCDGQQRLTTLYLLMGLLHKKINSNSLKDCLISTFEWENDDKECRLQYAIRESTLYFLNDLVDNCFINHQEISIIKKQSWYFNEYDLDPTIQSMINALGIIEKEISKKTPPQYLNDFTGFLLEKVKLLYFNMENRKRGEEMFVIINTTGEPLTPTENLKPKLIGLIENVETSELKSNEWEERETFFWSNRKKEEQEADDGVNEFLVWFAKIHFKKEETNLFKDISADSLDSVNGYFDSLKKLLRVTANNENIRTILGFIEPISSTNEKDVLHYYRNLKFQEQHDILLPLLAFIHKISQNEQEIYLFLRRLRKNYFDNKERCRKHNYTDWRYILQIIEKNNTINDCLRWENNFEKIGTLELPKSIWFNNEEQIKQVIANEKTMEFEDLKTFIGDLSPLFRYILVFNNQIEIVNECESLNNFFDSITITDNEKTFLQEQEDLLQQLEDTFNLYKIFFIENNVWIDVLNIRFWKNDSLWEGNWKFRRLDNRYTYRRWFWNNKRDKYFYQDWTYYLLNELKNLNEGDRNSALENFCLGFLEQHNEKFFSTKLNISEKIIDISLLYNSILEYKDTTDVNNYYFWLGYLWTVSLAKTQKNIPEFEEIIFDSFFDNTELKYELGNQFLWCKDWGGSAIRLHDNFEGLSWNKHLVYQDNPVEFVKDRERYIVSLFKS